MVYFEDIMEQIFSIINIPDLVKGVEECSYRGEVAVVRTEQNPFFRAYIDRPIYVNSFTYMVPLSGTAGLNIDDSDHLLEKGTFVQLTPLHLGYFHNVSPDFSAKMLSVSKSFVDQIPAYTVQDRIVYGIQTHGKPVMEITEENAARLLSSMEMIEADIADTGHKFRIEMIRNSVVRFFLEIDNALGAEETELPLPRYGKVLRSFMGLLMDNFRTEHSVTFYSDALNLSPQYLTAVIKGQTGKTVSDFIDEMLYSEARNLLADSEMSIQQIAEALHFSDQSAFTKFFKRQSSVTPKVYRKKSAD